ncbi:MAG TPA: hypothetical protein VHY18_06520 [Solirubrobacteraceae bacterium]|jgi:hypothetical protein|nr:hypothetical protein [Solirubrobacteraceae bacterium]
MTILPQVERQLKEAAERRAKFGAERLDDPASVPSRPRARRLVLTRTRAGVLAGVALAVVLALLGFALVGGEGARQFNVAAAVYRAITPGTGVRYVVTEQEAWSGRYHDHNYVQRWSTRSPRRERVIVREQRSQGREHSWLGESAVTVGGTSWDWGSNEPGVVLRQKGVAILDDELERIRAAYRSGLLRPIGKSRLDGREVYRLRASHPHMKAGGAPDELLVDAKTFVPVEAIDYARGPHGRMRPIFVMRYRVFEELPATPANLAKLNMAPHRGTRVITHR